MSNWEPWLIPCRVCKLPVYTRRDPADPNLLQALHSGCGRSTYGILEGIPDDLPKGVPSVASIERRHERALEPGRGYEPPVKPPAPLVPSTECPDGDERVPPGAWAVAKKARKAGVYVVVTFARGYYQTSTTMRVVDSVAVRMRRGPVGAVGIWHNGRYETGMIFSRDRLEKAGATRLKEWISVEH